MGILYKPLSIIAGIIKKRAGRAASTQVWAQLNHPEGPPAPTNGRHPIPSLAGSAALEAALIAAVSASVDQLFARAFHYLFGAWPSRPAESKDSDSDSSDSDADAEAQAPSGPVQTAIEAAGATG